jgi:hypothetical protein
MLTTTTTPKCTMSMPSTCAVGISTGTITSRMVVPSSTQPSSSSSTLAARRKVTGLSCQARRTALIARGMFSMVTT